MGSLWWAIIIRAEGAHEFVGAISAIAQKLGWPILTDVLNPLRTHLSAPEGLDRALS
jgi:2-succinyl-5-enolpyruvyl-6-hydroxy-3-cyclohexene-1-carboxylate synthase